MRKQREGKAKVSVIVLTFNSVSKLRDFFDRVFTSLSDIGYSNVDVLFVDNNSQDKTVDYLKRRINGMRFAKNTRILQLRKNYGWAGGNNRGALMCKDSDYLMFLNDDVILESNTVAKLVNRLEADALIGAAQPLVMNVDGTSNCGFDLGLGGFARPMRLEKIPNATKIIDTFYAMGSALITRTDLFFKIGMFDEDYFHWYDDVDYCWRVRLAGYKVSCLTTTKACHYVSATLGEQNPILWYYLIRNNLWVLAKDCTLGHFLFKVTLMMGETFVSYLGHSIFRLRDYKRAKNIIKGFLDGLKGLPKALHKRERIKEIRRVKDSEITKMMDAYIDVRLLFPVLKSKQKSIHS